MVLNPLPPPEVARGGGTGPLPAPTIGSLLAVAAFSKSHQRPVGGWVGSVESGVRQNGGGGEPGSRVASATALPPSVGSESMEKAEYDQLIHMKA